jgi:TIR domain
MLDPVAFKYRAFLSYSHTDADWAKWLHAKLEGFRIDKDLVGRETATGQIPKTLRPIFRDREDFTAGETLNEQTLAALDASAALIVLCSPASAKSHYVNEELRLFKSRHPDRPVIPVIVGGTPSDPENECFAPALKFKIEAQGQVTTVPEDLLAADVREEADGRNLAIAKTVARLLDLQTDDVFRRAERERRRQERVRSTIGLVIAGLMAVGGFLAWQSHQRQQTIAEVEAIVAKYSVAGPAEAAVPDTKEGLTKAITAIAEGAAGDPRYAKALELLKAGKPVEAEPLLKAVAEEKEKRAASENKQAAAAYENLGAITRLSDPKRAREVYAKAAALGADKRLLALKQDKDAKCATCWALN